MNESGIKGQETGDRSQQEGESISPSEARQYPPGVDKGGLEFNAQAFFPPMIVLKRGGVNSTGSPCLWFLRRSSNGKGSEEEEESGREAG